MNNYFTSLLEETENPLITEAVDQGYIPVGYTCSYVPDVLLTLGDIFPVRLRAPGITGTEMADTYLSSVICSFSRSILEYFMDGRYDFLQGTVCTAGCDHLRRLYDNLEYLAKPAFNYILDVPHRISENALDWFVKELHTFIEALSRQYGVSVDDDILINAIEAHNAFHGTLRSIGNLRLQDNPPLTGAQFHRILLASLVTPRHLFMKELETYRQSLNEMKGARNIRARLMLVGCQLDDPEYIATIESQGGLVVADRFCTGSLPGLEDIEITGDPVTSIARHYLGRTNCPRMMEDFNKRFNYIVDQAKRYRVDGVIIEAVKFCDIWGVEMTPMVSALRKASIPVLRLEREYRHSGEGQLRTRVQAFLESMGR